jgi:hypothetical protein
MKWNECGRRVAFAAGTRMLHIPAPYRLGSPEGTRHREHLHRHLGPASAAKPQSEGIGRKKAQKV